jgi:hypothetical protein
VVHLLADDAHEAGRRAREEQLPHGFPHLVLVDGRGALRAEKALGRHHPALAARRRLRAFAQ